MRAGVCAWEMKGKTSSEAGVWLKSSAPSPIPGEGEGSSEVWKRVSGESTSPSAGGVWWPGRRAWDEVGAQDGVGVVRGRTVSFFFRFSPGCFFGLGSFFSFTFFSFLGFSFVRAGPIMEPSSSRLGIAASCQSTHL